MRDPMATMECVTTMGWKLVLLLLARNASGILEKDLVLSAGSWNLASTFMPEISPGWTLSCRLMYCREDSHIAGGMKERTEKSMVPMMGSLVASRASAGAVTRRVRRDRELHATKPHHQVEQLVALVQVVLHGAYISHVAALAICGDGYLIVHQCHRGMHKAVTVFLHP